jgi:cell division protein FtsI (penicillin-binding protein 3)
MAVPGLRTRVLILAAVLALGFGGVIARLAHLQVVRHAELTQIAERQYSRTVVLHAQRGPIVDRRGAPLATSSPAESLFAHPRAIDDPARVARRLAPVLGLPETELRGTLGSGRSFVWLRRRLPPPLAREVRALREPGLGLVPDALRLYPNRELAAHVLGFEGVDGGLEGVEGAWNEVLAGVPGRAVVGRDARGREVATAEILTAPVRGRGVMLALDTHIQYLVERELDAAYRRTGARGAIAVALEPGTGDVVALAVRPTFNPNAFLDVPAAGHWRNRAITDPFEPGSTFKAILAAAALEEGVVRPEDRVFAEHGRITIARTTIRDWKEYGWLTFAEVLQHSSNVGSIKVGLDLGADRYFRYITAFGFGAPTALGLPGESRGILREPPRWSALSLPTLSIGQEVAVTALQLTAAFGAIANGGTLMQPRLVRAIFDADGREVRRFGPRPVRQVVSPATARTLTDLLTGVVAHGTGRRAAVPGYAVAGKTGTAQKLDRATGRYSRAPGILSFVGFAPADEARFVLLVLLDEPRTEKWGSEAAAPVFAAIAADVLRYLEVPRTDAPPVQIVSGRGQFVTGAGQIVTTAGPAAGPAGRPLAAGLAPITGDAGERRMPDLAGRSLRRALEALAPLGVAVELQGHGQVVAQVPPPGVPLPPGSEVRLTLAPPLGGADGPRAEAVGDRVVR